MNIETFSVSKTGLLRLLHLASPALPVGTFAYSHGLEWAIERRSVNDAATSRDWIWGVVSHSLGRCDVPLLGKLYAAWEKGDTEAALAHSAWLSATRGSAELEAEDKRLGAALARLLASTAFPEVTAFAAQAKTTYACLFAFAAAKWQIGLEVTALAYLFSFVEAQVSAAVRLVPLGQSDGQRIIMELAELLPSIAERGLALEGDEIGASLPGHAMASALHETQYTRLFRS